MGEVAEEFSAFVAARQRALVRTAYLLTGDLHEAEDLVQAALVRTYRAWNRIRDRDGVERYVRRVMVNQHRSWWRRAWRRREFITERVPERTGTPDRDLAERDAVWETVCTLPPRQRAAVVLKFYEDLSPDEIAHALDCTSATVRSQLSRALATLRTRISNPEDASNIGVEGKRR